MNFLLGLFDVLLKGGWVAFVLAGLSALLWYAVGYRYLLLDSKYLGTSPDGLWDKKNLDSDDLLGGILLTIKGLFMASVSDRELAVQLERHQLVQSLKAHRQTITSIVVVAPLLGLLGTVIGMIETFESLQDASLFSQSGGIAGGISQALITTQMGLVVAIPGLLIGRHLDRKESQILDSLDRYLGTARLKLEETEI
ncbi:MAG: MotA/TolQ/ExbB proton channel family protein [Pseudomonadota bacterium]